MGAEFTLEQQGKYINIDSASALEWISRTEAYDSLVEMKLMKCWKLVCIKI